MVRLYHQGGADNHAGRPIGQHHGGHSDVRTTCTAEVLALLRQDYHFRPLLAVVATLRRPKLPWTAAQVQAALKELIGSAWVEELPTRTPRYAAA